MPSNGPHETRLPAEPAVVQGLAFARTGGADAIAAVAARNPSSSLAWAALADQALRDGRDLEGYAYARVGYHRGLDALRRNGWKGAGAVPLSHEPNRGVLWAFALLREASERIGEHDEVERLTDLLNDADPGALAALSRNVGPEDA